MGNSFTVAMHTKAAGISYYADELYFEQVVDNAQ